MEATLPRAHTPSRAPASESPSSRTAASAAGSLGSDRSPGGDEFRFGRPPENLPPLEPAVPTRIVDAQGVRLEDVDLSNGRDRSRFLDMVAPIYSGDPNFIVPLKMERMKFLDPARNPSFENLEVRPMLAHLHGRAAGRITAHVDRAYNRYHNANVGWFGFFECINDRRVAHALLQEAVTWLKGKGCTELVGPMNFTTNHQVGLLVENFDRPAYVEMTYNPRYYEELITSFGFGKAKDLFVWWIDISGGIENEKIARMARITDKIKRREGISLRALDMKRFDEEIDRLFGLYNAAWQKNWGFVPLTRKEFEAITNDLKQIVIPEIVLFVEVGGKAVGFSCALPNVNEVMPKNGRLFPFGWWRLATGMRKVKHGRLFTLGVVPEYRKRGLEALMMVETVVRAKNIGLVAGEIGWTLEDNDLINRAIQGMDAKLDRRYRLLGLRLA